MISFRSPASPQVVVPRHAAAMILLRDEKDPKVFWVKRSHTLGFMAGYHAFPGGQHDAADNEVPILAGGDQDASSKVTAIRELFEETGVLIARNSAHLSPKQLAVMRAELITNQVSFRDLIERESIILDAALLKESPRWVTPAHMSRRYDTRFYIAWLPSGQEAEVIPGELESGEWVRPSEALRQWADGDCVFVTPILIALQALTAGTYKFLERMQLTTQDDRDLWEQRVEFRRGFYLCSLRTPTIPPATHTNCYLVGGDDLVVIDPGSPYTDQQELLDQVVERFIAEGHRVREILLTHLHPDHIGGAMHLAEKFDVPIAAHPLTADAIRGEVQVDRLIEDGEVIELKESTTGAVWQLEALWTPGHARGHLSFYERRTGTLLTGDCVVGLGTVVIAPPEGEMNRYLDSLKLYLALPRLTALLPGHGPVVASARAKIEEYLAHRLQREAMILAALHNQALTIAQIVKTVYADVSEKMHQLAELSVLAHLEKLELENRVVRDSQQFKVI